MDQEKSRAIKIRSKAVGGGILVRFSNFDKCRPEEAADVVSGMALDQVGMNVVGKVDESRQSNGRIIRLFAG